MRDKAQTKINSNIIILNNIHVVNDSDGQWIKQQLITKHQLLLQHLQENIDTDMNKFCKIFQEAHKEVEAFVSKYS